MADYISRESILAKLKARFCAFCPLPDCDANCKIHYLLDAVKYEPAADVRPVVRGKWEWCERFGLYGCSNCHNSYVDKEWVTEGKWLYCPSCGADMRPAEGEK